jgi:AcrR family transcriptional regulator
MGAEAPTRKRRGDALAAAAAVFAEHGYHGASTRQIAERLQIRQGSLYYYFDSKDAALEEVCFIGIGEVLEGLEAFVASDNDAGEKVRQALANHLHYLGRHPDSVRTFLFCRHDLPPGRRDRVRQASRRYEMLIESVFEEGVADGSFRADIDPWFATRAFFALINSAATGYRPGGARSIEQLIDGFFGVLLQGVAAGQKKSRQETLPGWDTNSN